jgi:hypothetical protein
MPFADLYRRCDIIYCINRHRRMANMDQRLVAAWTSAHSHIYMHVECKNHGKKIVRAVKAGRASERVLWF